MMVAKWDRETIEKIVMISWKLWTHRNEVRHGGARKNEKALIDSALAYLEDYHSCVAVTSRKVEKKQAVWTPPPTNLYKINIDGAVFTALGAAGAGVLIRDGIGNVIGASCKKFQAPFGAIEAEAKAIELALQMTKDLVIQEFILESDSLILVNALKECSPPSIAVAAVVYNTLAASYGFRHVEFNHVGRQGNRPAHLLAKHVFDIDDFSVWIEETPYFLEQALLHDVSLVDNLV